MKRINIFINILIGISLGLWVLRAILSYINYARHIELFAINGWFWYEEVLIWGNYIIPIVAVCLITKIFIYKKTKSSKGA